MKYKKAPLALCGLILLIGFVIFLMMGGFTSRQDPPEPNPTSQQDSSAEPSGDIVDPGSGKDDTPVQASSDQVAKWLLPSQVAGRVFPKVDLGVLGTRLPKEKFAVFERMRLEFPEVDWTEIEQTHQAYLSKRSQLPLDLNDQQREAHAAWLAVVEPVSRALIELRAKEHGLSSSGMEGDRGYYIDGFRNGEPVYIVTTNVGAANTTGVSYVRWNPGTPAFDPALGSNTINGSEFYVTICDGGEIREHTEFQLPNAGGSRIVTKETGAYSDHMTHVAGTIAAWGYNASAQGMAPRSWIRALIQQSTADYTTYGMATPGQQMAEVNPITGNPQLRSVVGNTSLGTANPNTGYDSTSANYDTILRDYPYYMHFNSSGNSGDLGFASITGTWKMAKNMVAIGNISAATRDANGVFTGGATIAATSSRGPSYDGRIKPDFVAKGTDLTSSTGTTAYSSYSGTSMASPNAAGSVALLMDYVRLRMPQQYLRSSTYRALLTATADDRGNPGPDYTYGWGILNVHAAAKIVREQANNSLLRLIIEDSLAPNQTWTEAYASDGTKPIRVSIVWLDPASTNTDSASRASRLVNDLDVRLIGPGGTEYQPYVMPFVTGQGGTPAFDASLYDASAVTGDNTTDPVELIHLAAPPAGSYTLSVTHKGTLLNNLAQPFSVAVSGMTNTPPTMEVSRAGSTIDANGVNAVSGTSAGTGTQLSYTITNVGDDALELTTPVTISNPSNCSVTVVTQPNATLAKDQGTNLVLTVTPAASGTWSFGISVASNDPLQNPYAWTVTGIAGSATAPLMVVTDANGYLPAGGTRSLTGTVAGSASQMTSTIANLGNANLTLTTPITVTPVANCSISAVSQPASTVAPSASTNLVLSITPTAPGAWSATVSIASNHADKSPYTWTISGTAIGYHAITYLGNSPDSGAPPSDAGSPYLQGATVTVLGNTGALTKNGFSFAGWNTAANGTGTTYMPGTTFKMPGYALSLHAIWNTLPTVDAGPTQTVKLTAGLNEPGLDYGAVSSTTINVTTPNPKTLRITNVAAYTEDPIAGNTTEIYTGQIYDADGKISFTENIDDATRIWIDGVLVLSSDSWSNRASTANLNLSPGWHNIEIRIFNASGGSGPVSSPGIGYDPAGGTAWQTLVDPGDGSFLRVYEPDTVTVNLNGTVTDPEDVPATTWSVVSKNPSTAANPTFANASAIDTTAIFTEEGTYTLRLSANDGHGTRYDEVVIIVEPAFSYALTVTGGSGSGNYSSGRQVEITAAAPASGYRFVNWTSSGGGSFANASSATTTFTMPANAVTVTANYGINTAPVVNAGANQTIYLNGSSWTAGITYQPITGDGDSGISSTKTYTHAIDFGSDSPRALINGVQFQAGGTTFGSKTGTSATVGTGTTTISAAHGGNIDATPYLNGASACAMEALVEDMNYNNATGEITLTGLTPGVHYQFRLYHRQWAVGNRPQNIGFDTDGLGTTISQAEYTGTFDEDDATQPAPGFATATQVNTLCFDYSLPAGVTSLKVYINAAGAATYHLYGLTNEVSTSLAAIATLGGTATDADGDSLTTTWSVVSKNPPTAANPTFANASQASTSATFTEAGTYVLRLSTNDGYVTSADDITITVGDSAPSYGLTVTNGSGDGTYVAGAQVTITADAPAPGYRFVNWTSSGGGSFANASSSTTTFTMPGNAATVTANYGINTAPIVNAGADQTVSLQSVQGPAQMILAATNPIQGFRTAVVGGNTTNGISGTDWPTAESPPKAIDGSTGTKYLNFGKVGSGFYITPAAGATTLTGVRIYTANDAPGRDPLTISIEGSNGGDLSQGSSWTLIQDNINLGINTDPGRLTAGPLVPLSASASYTSYRIIVKSMRGTDNSVQYSELQLFGSTGITGAIVNLNGSATDADGDSLTTTWSLVSKNPVTAANPTFGNASQASTSATFTEAGTYVLRLSVNDGLATSTDDITITVGPPLPAKYATWAGGTFANPFTDTALTSNPDGDSMGNLMEFAFGTDPTLSSEGPLAIDGSSHGSPVLKKSGGVIEFYFVRRKDHGTSGSVSYTPQFSSNLSSFTNSAATPTWVANSASSPTLYEVVKVPFPNGTKFGRVEVSVVP